MDYVTRQFIVLTKKLRKEIRNGLEILHGDIQKHIEAVNEARNAYKQSQDSPQVLRAELQVPHSIEVETHPKDKKGGREWYKLVIDTFTLLGVLVYATVAIRQWREMISARHQTEQAIQAANRSATAAENTIQYTKDSDRPWIGRGDPIPTPPGSPEPPPAVQVFTNTAVVNLMWTFKVIGKRPARITSLFTTGDTYSKCTEHPIYDITTNKPERGLEISGSTFRSPFHAPVSLDKFNLFQNKKTVQYCAYALIEYEDVGDIGRPPITHHTKLCEVWNSHLQIFTGCSNRYDDAD